MARDAKHVRELIKVWEETVSTGQDKLDALRAELASLSIPVAPPPGAKLSVEVQFHNNLNVYEFLIKSVPSKGYYTTGTLPENSYFPTWAKLWAYFNSADVAWRTPFYIQIAGGTIGEQVDRRAEF